VLTSQEALLTSLYMALLCHCASVRTGDVRDAVLGGAQSLDEVARCTGAATGCGGCAEAICEAMAHEMMKPSYVHVRRQETVNAR
jgi:NAD(P)H-nitrite reductase large subunit